MFIGFNEKESKIIAEEFNNSTQTMKRFSHREIEGLAKSYSARTTKSERIHWNATRTKLVKALTDWVRELDNLNDRIHYDDVEQGPERVKEWLYSALDRAFIRFGLLT